MNMIKQKTANAPTPMAGLALGIASLSWCWESIVPAHGYIQLSGTVVACALLLILCLKFISFPQSLWQDLMHPVAGSIVPTFAMSLMVISKTTGQYFPSAGSILWLFAVLLHIVFFSLFTCHRIKAFHLEQMLPSWFVPPIGIIVADVAFPGNPALQPLAESLMMFGMTAYAVMLPVMLYRLIFITEIPDPAKPTIAIMAAPASLSLAGYLTLLPEPSPFIVALLGSIAVLMTVTIYVALFRLLRLPFSPGYAAFTFPLVIGATALFKTAQWLSGIEGSGEYALLIHTLATIELYIATLVVGYVCMRYLNFYCSASNVVPSEQTLPGNDLA